MNPSRVIFPGFWFGQSSLDAAKEAARRGVGGFCVYGGNAQETLHFVQTMREVSPYDHLLICADIDEDLSEVITDAPALPENASLGRQPDTEASAYKKGFLTASLARSTGINWVLCPVVDIGYQSPAFGENPLEVARLCGDYVAGMANGGVLNCIKYFPGLNGILKDLVQMEEAEFVPYKHMFRRADAVMPSDMIFSNIDPKNRAVMSEKIVKDLLKKRLNYKGCVVSAPLHKIHLKQEGSAAVQMLQRGVEIILAPQEAGAVLDAVNKEFEKGSLTQEIIHAISNMELLTSKVLTHTAPVPVWQEIIAQISCLKR